MTATSAVASAIGPASVARAGAAVAVGAEAFGSAAPASAAQASLAARPKIWASARVRELRAWLRAARGHGLWIAAWSLVGWGGTLASPLLLDHPFVLMLLAPRALFVALAVDSVDLLAFVALGTVRLAITDASYFILGRRFPRRDPAPRRLGTSLLRRVRRAMARLADGMIRWLCAHGLKAGTVLFLRPNGKYLAVAGAYGVSARVAGWASVVGTAVYLVAIHLGFGALL